MAPHLRRSSRLQTLEGSDPSTSRARPTTAAADASNNATTTTAVDSDQSPWAQDQNDSISTDVKDIVAAASSLEAQASTSTRSPPPPPLKRSRNGPRMSRKRKIKLDYSTSPEPFEPTDRLASLSSELISLILSFLSPQEAPDLASLANLCLVSKSMVPHCRTALYRNLRIETRLKAHALHRTLHSATRTNKLVRKIEADVGSMARTSSHWTGWFLFHSMHSLCGIIGNCRNVLSLTIYFPMDSAAWTQSLFKSFVDLKYLKELNKDLVPSTARARGAGAKEGMDIGWRPKKRAALWSVTQFLRPLSSFRQLHTLRLCGMASDSSMSVPNSLHSCRLTEVVLVDINVTNTDLLYLLGQASNVKKLTIWGSSILSKKGLGHVLRKTTSLVELKIGGSWFGAKEDDDLVFPIDLAMPTLPSLKNLQISGSLISPNILLSPSTNLSLLVVSNCSAFTPLAVHTSLANMTSDGVCSAVQKLCLPDVVPGRVAGGLARTNNTTMTGGGEGGGLSSLNGGNETWDEKWIFGVKALCEAKGVVLELAEDLAAAAAAAVADAAAGGHGAEVGAGLLGSESDSDED
ncbi:hypothetical protein ACM66B_006326 [Microbotryomycetes sp. NB124-2]